MTESTELVEEFKELYDATKMCYQCGTCAGGCPVYKVYPGFNPRRIMERLILDDTDNIVDREQIWYCTMCYNCSVRCPQGIDVGHVITEIKNLAVAMEKVPEGIILEMKAIMDTGVTAAISQSILKRREKLGLSELPPPDLNEIQKLYQATGALTTMQKHLTTQEDSD